MHPVALNYDWFQVQLNLRITWMPMLLLSSLLVHLAIMLLPGHIEVMYGTHLGSEIDTPSAHLIPGAGSQVRHVESDHGTACEIDWLSSREPIPQRDLGAAAFQPNAWARLYLCLPAPHSRMASPSMNGDPQALLQVFRL